MSTGRLAGKVAAVTGAASGIGLASARAFAAEGAGVACLDLDGAAAGIVEAGGRAIAVACDVRDGEQVEAAMTQTAVRLGPPSVAMCNAAAFTPSHRIVDLAEADWQQALAVNLTGVFLSCKHAIPHMLAAGGGSIIITASQFARVAKAERGAYCTTKGALLQLAKVIALEHAEENIRANTLSPGGVATDRLAWQFGDLETAEREWGPAHPVGRLGRPEEIAKAAVYLASDESSFMTGADLLVDGGYAAR